MEESMAMEPMMEDDGKLLQRLEFTKHFPPGMTDGQWRNVPNEFEEPVFQLQIRCQPSTQFFGHMLSQMAEDMNFDAKDAAYFDLEFTKPGREAVLQIAFMDTAAFPSVVPKLNETIASYGEAIKRGIEQESGFAKGVRPKGPLPPSESGDRNSRDAGRARKQEE